MHIEVTAANIVNIEEQVAADFAAKYDKPIRLRVRYVNAAPEEFTAQPPAGSHRTPEQTALGAVRSATGQIHIGYNPLTVSLQVSEPVAAGEWIRFDTEALRQLLTSVRLSADCEPAGTPPRHRPSVGAADSELGEAVFIGGGTIL